MEMGMEMKTGMMAVGLGMGTEVEMCHCSAEGCLLQRERCPHLASFPPKIPASHTGDKSQVGAPTYRGCTLATWAAGSGLSAGLRTRPLLAAHLPELWHSRKRVMRRMRGMRSARKKEA